MTLYAEDMTPGRIFEFGSYEVTREEMLDFARKWDPLPIHLDDEVAAKTPFGEIIASGVQTIAIHQRLGVASLLGQLAIVAGLSSERISFPKPVKAGAVITGTQTVKTCRLLEDGRGVVHFDAELHDQHGDRVLELTGGVMVRRRPAAA